MPCSNEEQFLVPVRKVGGKKNCGLRKKREKVCWKQNFCNSAKLQVVAFLRQVLAIKSYSSKKIFFLNFCAKYYNLRNYQDLSA